MAVHGGEALVARQEGVEDYFEAFLPYERVAQVKLLTALQPLVVKPRAVGVQIQTQETGRARWPTSCRLPSSKTGQVLKSMSHKHGRADSAVR